VNKDLADILGNFVNRILKFCETRCGSVVPEGGEPGELERKLYAQLSEAIGEATEQFEAMEYRKAAQAVRRIWVIGNEYLTEAAPWTAIKTDPARGAMIVRTGLNLVALFAAVSQPVVPFAAATIAGSVGLTTPLDWPSTDAEKELNRLTPGAAITVPAVLFKKIEDEQVAEWTERFGGSDAAA
jgi:methionyl-tRNA synthetase